MAGSAAVPPRGVTLYVSKLGDGSDGRSWRTALPTVQAALDAVPDDQGGHTIVIRPDTYMEANLFPAHPGAAGAYNRLVGDVDGSWGSGTAGHVILDAGDPALGFKSYDWWGTLRTFKQGWSNEHVDESFSAIGWDRWHLQHLYATGGDGGFMFDCVDRIEPFSVRVEDCISIGRAFGGGVASCLSRADEPITFRRCCLWALDWWGDTSGAYVRIENPSPPGRPDVRFIDCTMVGPQCALKASNYGFTTFSHVEVQGCRLIALNFSQPHGTPTDGVIQSVQHGQFLHVDLQDSTLMGFKVFGSAVAKDSADAITYTARRVQAYVQYTQAVPAGMHRLGHWPADVFAQLLPPSPQPPRPTPPRQIVARDLCELTPLVWQDRLCHLECVRPGAGGTAADYYLRLCDAQTGTEHARFATGYGLACAWVEDGVFHAFASRWVDGSWNDVTQFTSTDLQQWDQRCILTQDPGENLFNTSVCRGPDGYVLAYESSDPAYPAFTTKFARSADLQQWQKVPGALFATDRYTACPCLRWADGWYYMLYLEHRGPRHCYETYITRSRDLLRWETSAANPVLRAQGTDEGINASDPELVEWQGQTWLYFAVGDQLTWMDIKRSACPGTLAEFLASWFRQPGIPDRGAGAGC